MVCPPAWPPSAAVPLPPPLPALWLEPEPAVELTVRPHPRSVKAANTRKVMEIVRAPQRGITATCAFMARVSGRSNEVMVMHRSALGQ
jgi:hypothetical protein